ncbi:MAG: hypothetical protein E7453_06345 [Ruminococcaceae bacterium]|nr:hypothetical protein [Oscillospiraceae bacterium]
MGRFFKFLFASIGILFLLALLVVGIACAHSLTYQVPTQDPKIENTTGLVQASGRALYDANGDILQLIGVNVGQILLQEGWMSPFATEALKNEDGSYVKDDGDNIQYPEFTEAEFRKALKENPNLQGYDIDELLRLYWDAFMTEEDFRIIKEDLQLNTIRFPIYYLNILNEDLTLREDAFSYIDWFIEQAAKNELYIILDLHGAPGSQNGYEHSGEPGHVAGLWTNDSYLDATALIWDTISEHYTNERPDLGKWIATYDLLNEPTYTYQGFTTRECWDFFDRLYDLIRDNGDQHVITMSGCWDFINLPDPNEYGWKNVQYQYHWYNWLHETFTFPIFCIYKDFTNILCNYDVPVLIGEFTFFENKDAWASALKLFDDRYYSWTIWNYKTVVTGWWDSSWGVYTCQLKFVTEWEEVKCNPATCTYEEYVAVCEKTRTENCVTGTLYEVLQEYARRK